MSAWPCEIYVNGKLVPTIIGTHDVKEALIVAKRLYPDDRVKVKVMKDQQGDPRLLILTTVQELHLNKEQCWADTLDADGNEVRCPNTARINFHTCSLHTTYTAPCFGTEEYEQFMRDIELPLPTKEVTDKQIRKTMRKERLRKKKIDDLYIIKDDEFDLL